MFQSGVADLEVSEKEKLDVMVSHLKSYSGLRILVEGHTSFLGDADANLALSQERADAVARYLMITYAIDPNRIRSAGFGGAKTIAHAAGRE